MSFNPFSFFRNPPPTVPDPSMYQAPAAAVPAATVTTGQNASVAATISAALSNLADTAKYLQSVILSLTQGIAVTSDSEDVQRALSTLYGSVPPAISTTMYANLVAAELAALQVDRALGANSSMESNPFILASIQTLTGAVENALQSDGSYLSQAAVLLRFLQADQLVYSNLQAGLATYPAASGSTTSNSPNVVPVSGIDVSPDTAAILNNYTAGMGQAYGSLYQSLATPSPLDRDVGSVVNSMMTVSPPDMIRLSTMLGMVNQSSVQNSFSDLTSGPSAATYPQVLSELSGQHFQLDMLNQTAFSPLKTMSNGVGSAVSELQGAAAGNRTVVRGIPPNTRATSGPLAGLANNNSVLGGSLPVNQSPGMQELSSVVDWAQQQTAQTYSTSSLAFQKLTTRNVQESSSRVQLLNMSNSLGTLTSLSKAFTTEEQSGNVTATQNSDSQLAMVSRILSNTQTGNKTSYTVTNGTISLASPTLPAPTSGAAQVFQGAGINTSLSGLTASL